LRWWGRGRRRTGVGSWCGDRVLVLEGGIGLGLMIDSDLDTTGLVMSNYWMDPYFGCQCGCRLLIRNTPDVYERLGDCCYLSPCHNWIQTGRDIRDIPEGSQTVALTRSRSSWSPQGLDKMMLRERRPVCFADSRPAVLYDSERDMSGTE
jgi:hypothetical protein